MSSKLWLEKELERLEAVLPQIKGLTVKTTQGLRFYPLTPTLFQDLSDGEKKEPISFSLEVEEGIVLEIPLRKTMLL